MPSHFSSLPPSGNSEIIACSYADLPTTTKVGATVLVADGALVLKVTEVRETSVMAQVRTRSGKREGGRKGSICMQCFSTPRS